MQKKGCKAKVIFRLQSGQGFGRILAFPWTMKHFAFLLTILFVSCGRPKPADRQVPTDTQASSEKVSPAGPETDTIAATGADPALASKNQTSSGTLSGPIDSIRAVVKHINTSTLQKKHFEYTCDEKTKLDYYYENRDIVKISVDFGTVGDVYAKEDYYYDNGRLVFKYEFTEGGPACEGCIETNEYRSYISNGKVIKYLKNKTEEKCRRCEFGSSSKKYKLLKAETAEQMKKVLCR